MPYRSLRAFTRAVRRLGVVAVAATTVVATAGSLPAYAADAPTTFVTIIGDDSVETSLSQLFHPGNATITVSGTASAFAVNVDGGPYDLRYRIDLVAPQGQTLAPGAYEEAGSGWFAKTGGPLLAITGGPGSACSGSTGRFVVHDVAVGGNGVIERFDATYEHHCGVNDESDIGQIVVGQPRDAVAYAAGDRTEFSAVYPVTNSRTAPVWLHNRGTDSLTVTGATLGGPGAAAYSVVSNGCATLAAGAYCAVSVRFRPPAAETYDATLTFTHGAGSTVAALLGRGVPGHTALYLRSEPGDFLGDGQKYDMKPATSSMVAFGGATSFVMNVEGPSGFWQVNLAPPTGASFEKKTYARVASFPTSTAPQLQVSGAGRGCSEQPGWFTVHDVAYTPLGEIARFAAMFETYCDGSAAALRGWVNWRAAEAQIPPVGPPPAVTGLTAYADVASVTLAWDNPAGVHSVVVRGAHGLTAPASVTSGTRIASGQRSAVNVGYLVPGASYSFSVFSKDIAGNVGPAAKITVRGSTLTLTRSASTVSYGSPVKITVKLVDTPTGAARSGREVDVFARRTGTREYAYLDTLTTNSSGVASKTLYPAYGYEFQATYYGEGRLLGATAGPAGVAVRSRVTATMNKTTVARSGAVTITGTVHPAKAGRTVYLQRYVGGAWKNYTSTTLGTSSTYVFTIRPGTAGTWKLRVYKPADGSNVAGASATRTLTVT